MTIAGAMAWTRVALVSLPTAEAGDVHSVVIDSVPYVHTVAEGETTADVAAALVAAIGTRARALGPYVYVYAEAPGLDFTVTASAPVSWGDGPVVAELRRFMRTSTDRDDEMLRAWLAAGAEYADEYTGVEADTLAEIPVGVRLGVYAFVRTLAESFDERDGLAQARAADVAHVWADPAHGDRARRAAEAYWAAFVRNPLLSRAPR